MRMSSSSQSHLESAAPNARPRRWNVVLWVAQVALTFVYLMAGGMKLAQPIEALAASGMAFVLAMPAWFVRLVGLLEVLGAIGILLPAATRIAPVLTRWAALGLSLLQVAAMLLHVSRGEYFMLPVNAVLLALALLVYWGRTYKVPIVKH